MSLLITAVYQVLLLLHLFQAQDAPKWEIMPSGVNSHLRGLCVVNDSVIWASGSGGVFMRSVDFGANWFFGVVPGAEELEFRDIHAFDEKKAWLLSSGKIGMIFITEDGGRNWDLQYRNETEGVFFDGLSFWNPKMGIAYSDPIHGRWLTIRTKDGGATWDEIDPVAFPPMLEGEAGFAASGTGIATYGQGNVWIASGGGPKSRIFWSRDWGSNWAVYDTPLRSGGSAGIFSVCFWSQLDGIVVGGDYKDSTYRQANCAVTMDGGIHWQTIETKNPNGYRSCVAANKKGSFLVTVGRTGSEYSLDEGRSWIPLGTNGYYSCGIGENWAFATGRSGQIARMKISEYISSR